LADFLVALARAQLAGSEQGAPAVKLAATEVPTSWSLTMMVWMMAGAGAGTIPLGST